LPNPEWLPHVLTDHGLADAPEDCRRPAAGPGAIPWTADHGRLVEDWVRELLALPPAERGISIEGVRGLARRLRELVGRPPFVRVRSRARDLRQPGRQHPLAEQVTVLVTVLSVLS
jgi:hypothetical protein